MCVCADYFAKHMGDYEGVLASLETLNLSILKAMDFTKKVSVEVCVCLFCCERARKCWIIYLTKTKSIETFELTRWRMFGFCASCCVTTTSKPSDKGYVSMGVVLGERDASLRMQNCRLWLLQMLESQWCYVWCNITAMDAFKVKRLKATTCIFRLHPSSPPSFCSTAPFHALPRTTGSSSLYCK